MNTTDKAIVLGHIDLSELRPSSKTERQNKKLHRTAKQHEKYMAYLNRRARVSGRSKQWD